jgi:predicted dehydrogenase
MNTLSSRKIRVGLIGVGNWGRYGHIPVLRLLPNYEIVALSSRRKEYGGQLAKEFGIPHVFTEAAELIGHPVRKSAQKQKPLKCALCNHAK